MDLDRRNIPFSFDRFVRDDANLIEFWWLWASVPVEAGKIIMTELLLYFTPLIFVMGSGRSANEGQVLKNWFSLSIFPRRRRTAAVCKKQKEKPPSLWARKIGSKLEHKNARRAAFAGGKKVVACLLTGSVRSVRSVRMVAARGRVIKLYKLNHSPQSHPLGGVPQTC